MRFHQLRLQDFRNIGFTDVDLSADRIFLLGSNGQGKSNLLESLGLVTALRSFRTQGLGALSAKGKGGFVAAYSIEHELRGETDLEIEMRGSTRKVRVDEEPVTRMSDFIGQFPVVALSSGDLMILRGSPAERRRFVDLTLSAIDRQYFKALREYHRAIAERNRLLKRGAGSAELGAFEAEIGPRAVLLAKGRRLGVDRIREVLCRVYTELADGDEGPELNFKESFACDSVESVIRMLRESRQRDSILGSTQKGPHRDDFSLAISIGGAKEYASDGQQRGLCVALRIAQAQLFRESLNIAPVILADDVLGELDPVRRAGFWRACSNDLQIIASGTEPPADCSGSSGWVIWSVKNGSFDRC